MKNSLNNRIKKLVERAKKHKAYWKESIKLNKWDIKFNKNLVGYYDQLLRDPFKNFNPIIEQYLKEQIIIMNNDIKTITEKLKVNKKELKSLKNRKNK